ncbi:hypothetical protein GALMADRAFT_273280 [Galerina marginata CBS 339.88]|uniref:Uncharacterized protein n=1 Tax=Galerina marginata (strain CBS 339.88) TaxID=685588 RepID=A0A067SAT9_GALM3|nr:hypothetical protein GALMADRAFT_273280 [Galerina marginata CBS 339.88]
MSNPDVHPSAPGHLKDLRPILTHLNADTSWLLSIPLPPAPPNPAESDSIKKERLYFHILLDPWFRGSQSDVAAFFSEQWHATPSDIQTISELLHLISSLESSASDSDSNSESELDSSSVEDEGEIDAVLISHEFTDHMHQATLQEISPAVPVYAPAKAAGIIRSWNHFRRVITVVNVTREGDAPIGAKWRDELPWTVEGLPSWLRFGRLEEGGKSLLSIHSALVVVFETLTPHRPGSELGVDAEAVIYTPHGIPPSPLRPLFAYPSPIRVLSLLHGLHDVRLSKGQLNLGAKNGLAVQMLIKARYWIGTHDEVKKGSGIVSWFLSRKAWTLEDAMKEGEEEVNKRLVEEIEFKDVENGGRVVLE